MSSLPTSQFNACQFYLYVYKAEIFLGMLPRVQEKMMSVYQTDMRPKTNAGELKMRCSKGNF